jgi:6-phosphogluconolactonase (cycloisomerase 2 family)
VGTGPASVAVDSAGPFVYVVNQRTKNIFAFKINSSSGNLNAIDGSPFSTGNAAASMVIAQ